MSLASETSSRARDAVERPPRWSKMRSREASEYSATPAASEEAGANGGGRRMVYARSRSDASSLSLMESPQPRSRQSPVSSARSVDLDNAEIRMVVHAVGQSAIDNDGTIENSLNDILRDEKGNVRRSDIRRFFTHHRVGTRHADRFFDVIGGGRPVPIDPQDPEEQHKWKFATVPMAAVKNAFDIIVNEHLAKPDRPDHQHHNVHGLLRPRHGTSSTCSKPQPFLDHHEQVLLAPSHVLNKEKVKKVAKKLTGKSQRRFVDRSGNVSRQELQHWFGNYGVAPEQANDIFDRLDTARLGHIKYTDFCNKLNHFFEVEQPRRKPSSNGKRRAAETLDKEEMARLCEHIGGKAAQKHSSVHTAFRAIDKDHENKVDRYEVRNFFRHHGSKTESADKFFDTLDSKREGRIDFHEFRDQFASSIQPTYASPSPGWDVHHYGDVRKARPRSCDHLGHHGRPQSARESSRRASSSHSRRASSCQNELRQNIVGPCFQGLTTYQASFMHYCPSPVKDAYAEYQDDY